MSIKVIVAGINGRMGRASAGAVVTETGLELVGAFDRKDAACVGTDVAELLGLNESTGVRVVGSAQECLESTSADVLVDFTVAEAALENARLALSNGVRPVIGTSGLKEQQIEKIRKWTEDAGLASLVIPNFSVGAVLMMEFARMAGKHFDNVEITELHGPQKLDAPSGTAMYTVMKLEEHEKQYNQRKVVDRELVAGSRGGATESGVRVHSLRMPGLISAQDVLFGSEGELLTVRHQSFNTGCFLKGILLSIKAVKTRSGLTIGLEHLL